jgi:vacuolar protein-sorting-associated protein 4
MRVNTFYIPCAPSEPGAMKMTMHEIPEPELLKPADVSVDDFMKAISNIKPTVSADDLIRQDEFTKNFGSEG